MSLQKRAAIGLGLLLGLLLNICGAHESRRNGTQGFLFSQEETPFFVPLPVNVGLVGFKSDGGHQFHMDQAAFTQALTNSMEAYTPACVETQDKLHVQYDLQYNVVHFEEQAVLYLEQLVVAGMAYTGARDGYLLYDVEITKIEDQLDAVYAHIFQDPSFNQTYETTNIASGLQPGQKFSTGMQKMAGPPPIRGPSTTRVPHAILFLNLDKTRMVPPGYDVNAHGVGKFRYRYRYGGATLTQSWVGKRRYIVVDLAAGPCEYGVTNAGEGTVSLESIPNLENILINTEKAKADTKADAHHQLELSSHIQFVSQMSSLVISAVRHVFVPDMRFSSLDFAEKVIVPVIVLRNHKRFNPLIQGGSMLRSAEEMGPVNEFGIDVQYLREEIKKMLLPNQELVMTTGMHNLHDHKHISMAVFKALRGDTVHTANPSGSYVAKTVAYIDSAVLVEEMKNAVDLLVAGLKHAGVEAAELIERGEKAHGHRILPVYVLSLLGLPHDLLFDRKSLHIVTKDFVLVLQTGASPIYLPFFHDNGIISMSPRSPNRHILAGVASALGGLTAPYERFDTEKKGLVSDYIWANGYHPFGPFSAAVGMSEIFLDTILRNSVLSRVNAAYHLIREAVTHLDEFTMDYVFDPVGNEIQYWESGGSPIDLPLNFIYKEEKSPLAHSVVLRLTTELESLEQQFVVLAQLLHDFKLDEADKHSATMLVTANAFVRYAHQEMEETKDKLTCCRKVHRSTDAFHSTGAVYWNYFKILALGGVIVWLVSKFIRSGGAATARFDDYLTTGNRMGIFSSGKPKERRY